ncbi:MAG: putative phospholipid-binding lipoprotein MlaA [Nitrospira sp.]|nr:putative phospholipid-binding lipoprotein MlaA [Nitrospira sp.]
MRSFRLLAIGLLGFVTLLAPGCAGRVTTVQPQALSDASPVVEQAFPPTLSAPQNIAADKPLYSIVTSSDTDPRLDPFVRAVDPFARANEYYPLEAEEQTPVAASTLILVSDPSTSPDAASDKQPDTLIRVDDVDPRVDPFATADEEAREDYDPWEPMNARIFAFNRQLDRFVLKPVATGYDFLLPDWVQGSVRNIFYNLRFVPRVFNNVFQGKLKGASIEVSRFLVNSTLGGLGMVDVAKDMGLETPEEDFGQTLGWYGLKSGPYLVLPLLPPFTVRDFVGFLGDIALNPINWLVAPLVEVKNVPSLIAHKNRDTSTVIQLSTRIGEIVNERSTHLGMFQGIEDASLDFYTTVRNAYLQKRHKATLQ